MQETKLHLFFFFFLLVKHKHTMTFQTMFQNLCVAKRKKPSPTVTLTVHRLVSFSQIHGARQNTNNFSAVQCWWYRAKPPDKRPCNHPVNPALGERWPLVSSLMCVAWLQYKHGLMGTSLLRVRSKIAPGELRK